MTIYLPPSTISIANVTDDENSDPVKLCQKWMSLRHDYDSSGNTKDVPGGLCFDGSIDKKSAEDFAAMLNRKHYTSLQTIVVRSVGGEVGAGMIMGRAILKNKYIVRVQEICLSSCANYLLSSGSKKIVPKDALLAFHGGVRALSPSEVEKESADQGRSISHKDAIKISSKLHFDYNLQTKFLKKARINIDFFDWMERFNHLSLQNMQRYCAGYSDNTDFFVIIPNVLDSFGYKLNVYQGPASQQDLQRVLTQDGWPKDFACIMSASPKQF